MWFVNLLLLIQVECVEDESISINKPIVRTEIWPQFINGKQIINTN